MSAAVLSTFTLQLLPGVSLAVVSPVQPIPGCTAPVPHLCSIRQEADYNLKSKAEGRSALNLPNWHDVANVGISNRTTVSQHQLS